MKILITGVSGFIGSRLLTAACSLYGPDNVVALSSRTNSLCETITYDSKDFSVNPTYLVKLDEVDVLIHAGAYTPKRGADNNAIAECNGNIFFLQMLLSLPFKSLKKFVYLSTLDVYESANPITEATPTLPSTLYGMSKLYCERMSGVFAANIKIPCQILRLGHVYGPGEEKYAKFLPNAIANILDEKTVELWGDGSELRSFIYVDDVVKAILAAVVLTVDVGVINVVGGTSISIRQMLDQLIAVSGKQVELVTKEYDGPRRDYIFDNTRLKAHLLPEETEFQFGLMTEYEYAASLR